MPGDAVVNLRDQRIKYSVSSMDEKNRQSFLSKAMRSLEQYFDLIVFAAYVEDEDAGSTGVTFSSWLQVRIRPARSPGNRLIIAE
jgi:hypothetical protein